MVNTEEQEIWKTYPEYPFLQASNLGRIRTVDRVVMRSNGRKCFVKGRALKPYRNKDNYMRVHFRANGKIVSLSVHRIVATCFIPNPDNLPEVNHKDCNPTNNRPDNLEWCTGSYNCQYREKYGKALGRPVIAINPGTSEVFWFKSQREAARQLGINLGNINEVIKGKRHKAGGYWFTKADKNAVEKTRAKFGDDIAKKVERLMNEHRN